VSNLVVEGGTQDCNVLIPQETTVSFTFESNVEGTYHLMCDLDENGVFDIAGGTDLIILADAVPGTNQFQWNGVDAAGQPVAPGTYDCRVDLATGEFHFVGDDIETCYEGIRIYKVTKD